MARKAPQAPKARRHGSVSPWMVMTLLIILKAGSDSGRVQWRMLSVSDREDVIEVVSIERPDLESKLDIRVSEIDYEPPSLLPPTNFTATLSDD